MSKPETMNRSVKPETDGPVDTAMEPPGRTSWWPNRERLRYWSRRIGHFGAWQIISQSLQLITGFLLVRWLSIEGYAQYGVALSFQNMLNLLMDLGFSGAILALVGERIHNREVVGRHVHAALSFRNRMLVIISPLSAVAFFWLAHTHHWPVPDSIFLFSSIVGFLVFQGWTACYTPPLLMHMQITRLYRPGVALNAAKLLVCAVIHAVSVLGATAVCWLNALSSMVTAFLYRSSARPYLSEPDGPDVATTRAIRKYIAPLVPGIVFFAFQGQIQVLLITVFGKSQSIAEVTALGRIGQLFLFLSAFNGSIVTPYIARVPFSQLAMRYSQAIMLSVAICGLLVGLTFFFPGPFLWLLGPKYDGLQLELGMSVIASSLAIINGSLYTFNGARKWVYYWSGMANILGLIAIQIALVASMDLTTTAKVIVFSIFTSLYSLIVLILTAVHGYRQEKASSQTVTPT